MLCILIILEGLKCGNGGYFIIWKLGIKPSTLIFVYSFGLDKKVHGGDVII